MASVRIARSPAHPSSHASRQQLARRRRRCLVATSLWLAASLTGCAEGGDAAEQDFIPPDGSADVTVHPEAGKDAAKDGSVDAEAAAPDASEDVAEDVAADVPGDGECPSSEKLCEGACVDAADPANGCGAASCEPCALANATAKCAAGACAIESCHAGFSDCNTDALDGCEADTKTDPSNCGGCGDECVVAHATPNCLNGTCGIAACEAGYDNCDFNNGNGCEANLQYDPTHCGACETTCYPLETMACVKGQCKATSCSGMTGDCDLTPGCETDLSSNMKHCGFCFNECSLPNAVPVCLDATCRVQACNQGYANCDGAHPNGCEIKTTDSTSHCGQCDAPCSTSNNSSRACEDGKCSYTCNPDFADCNGPQAGKDDDGCETPISSDPLNCGGCGLQCVNPHGSSSCVAKACVPKCDPGWDNCNHDAADGCEASLQTGTATCGACNVACVNAHGTTACVGGACKPDCAPGFADCDGILSNGCETDLATSGDHCGQCGRQCLNPHGTTECKAGLCSPVCLPGYASCDGDPIDGCEAQTTIDPENCGTCGHKCVNPNGTAACSNSVCTAGCDPGFGDCNVNIAGCETSLYDVNNCGACGAKCSTNNATATCPAGACILACSNGFRNCDNLLSNGCEISVTNDAGNCGSCGFKCEAVNTSSTKCESSSCVPTCLPGFKSCDANPANGCERDVRTDASNCGDCGAKCVAQNGTIECKAGTCEPHCNAGYASCDNDPNDGCETDLLQDATNCGGCGNSCAAANAQTSCSSGSCAIVACFAQYYNLDGVASNGCEYHCEFAVPSLETCDGKDNDCDGVVDDGFDKLNDPNNCGTCGTKCGTETGGLCCNGTCRIASSSDCGACGKTCTQGMLVINELMMNPQLNDLQAEWIELYNTGSASIDIRGFTLKDLGADNHVITSSVPVVVPGLGYAVLGINANKSLNGNVSVVYQYSNLALGNGGEGDEVVLLGHAGVEIDRVVWTSSTFVNPEGYSKELSLNHRTYLLNNTLTNWCQATQSYFTSNYGTPGTANTCTK